MNTIVEHINSAGFSFVEFALPMLVQSSVLIVILLLADLLLRKKVKAVFRYWIWMLVLVKLVLPTSLSSPLSLGYLFGDKLTYQDLAQTSPILEPTEPAPADISPGIDPLFIQPNPYISPTAPVTSVFEPAIAEPVSPPEVPVTPLSWQGVVFLVWLAVVIAMGLLLLQRALFVRGLVAQSKEAGRLMNDALAYCCASMGIKSKVGLKVSPNATTPSVCGLIRPVILVPWNLVSTLGASRMRTVLMHELAHIKRADLWVNLAQTALQIIYFYNPLLWLANCVIRRIREQAVDEAVLVAMGEKAQKYPQTLVDVAKMAFKRPALSLRLIGVVESKSALAGRIKHILGRPMPKTAKLGIIGLLAVIIAGAILLPMAAGKDDQGASEDIAKASEFMATLPNDVTVELVGICEHPSEGKQWRKPDGDELLEAPYDEIGGNVYPDGDEKSFEFAIRLGNLPTEHVNTKVRCEESVGGSAGGSSSPQKNGEYMSDFRWLATTFPKKLKACTVKVGVAAGQWQPVAESNGKGFSSRGSELGGVSFTKAFEVEDGISITVADDILGRPCRVVAITNDGEVVKPVRSSGSSAGKARQTTAKFNNISLSDIKEFQFQTRPYEWVEFKNVSLQPGVKTDVQAEGPTKEDAVSNPPQPELLSATPPIFAYNVKLNFADPTVRDGTFHSEQSIAFCLSFHNIEIPPAGKFTLSHLLIGQTTWPVHLEDNGITIKEGVAGQKIRSLTWPADEPKFEKVIKIPVKYGQKEYSCPVRVQLDRRDKETPTGSYWFCAYLSGRLPWGAGGRGFEIVNLDQQMEFRLTGDGGDPRDAVLGIDIDGDGKIDPAKTGGEQFDLYEPFQIGPKTYRLAEVDPYLPRVVFRELVSEKSLKPPAKTDVQVEVEGAGAVSGESQVKPAANEMGPRIAFESLVCDLGRIPPRTKHVCEFKFTNTGNEVLKITKVRSTCGCIISKLKKKEYAPGESETLEATYQSSASTERVKKYVFVYSNDKVNPKVILTVKAEVVIKVAHEPKRLSLMLDKENAGCPAITLTSIDNQPFSITGFKSTGDNITADFDSSVKETSFVFQPKVDMEKLGKGLNGRIEISLNHPECKTLMIVYKTLPEFEFDPRVVYVRDAEPLKSVTKTVHVRSNYKEDVEIESTSTKKGIVKVLTKEKVRHGFQFELEITPPAAESKARVFTDVFTVKLKDGQQLQITCYGIYSKKPAKTIEESTSKTDVQVEVEGADKTLILQTDVKRRYPILLTWPLIQNVSKYVVKIKGIRGSRPTTNFESTTNSLHLGKADIAPGRYHWTVSAYDKHGNFIGDIKPIEPAEIFAIEDRENGKMVLIDLNHSAGHMRGWGYYNHAQYMTKELLENAGFEVEVNNRDLLTADKLKSVDLLICHYYWTGWPSFRPYLKSELSAVRQFVEKGGSLLVVGCDRKDGGGKMCEAGNELVKEFGLLFELDKISEQSRLARIVTGQNVISFSKPVPVQLPVSVQGRDSVSLLQFDGVPIARARQFGKGKVIVAGVGMSFLDCYLGDFEHREPLHLIMFYDFIRYLTAIDWWTNCKQEFVETVLSRCQFQEK